MSEVEKTEEQKVLGIPKTQDEFPACFSEELKFENKWVLWEQWKLDKNNSDYDKACKEVAAFHDVISFW